MKRLVNPTFLFIACVCSVTDHSSLYFSPKRLPIKALFWKKKDIFFHFGNAELKQQPTRATARGMDGIFLFYFCCTGICPARPMPTRGCRLR
ncbi:hypothetical protein BX070DRAFT_227784 [Coemansia spiralis]|nr:hypothetical protein BX070DRAFT_227784 [Coemansia spiralis]